MLFVTYTTPLDSVNAAAIKIMTRGFYLSKPHLKATGQTSCQKHQQWQGAGLAFTCQIHAPVNCHSQIFLIQNFNFITWMHTPAE